MLDGEELAGAAEPGLDLVGDEQDAVLLGHLPQLAQELERCGHEAPLAKDGLDDDGGHSLGRHLRFEEVVQGGERLV